MCSRMAGRTYVKLSGEMVRHSQLIACEEERAESRSDF